jgi:intraflagellar transport protein 122
MRTLNEHWLIGEILAYQGKYKEAASHFLKNNLTEKAIDLYTSLKKFSEANELIRKFGNKRGGADGASLEPVLLIKQAEYERDSGNWKEAADLFI